ncbi:hypothetical protein CHUAL_001233 [Chamberlinius hualienensis]
MSGAGGCAKCLLLIFNVLFLITGIVVLSVGSWIKSTEKDYYPLIGSRLFTVCSLLIAVGVLIVVFGLLGCYSAIKENRFLLYTYAWLLCIIFGLEYAAGITAFVFRGELIDETTRNLNNSIIHYQDGSSIGSQWDMMQQDLQCCGVNSFQDWSLVFVSPEENAVYVPGSCCITQTSTCDINSLDPIRYSDKTMFTEGCATAAVNEYDHYAVIIGGVPIGISFFQILGIIFACCMAISIKK